MLKHSKSEFLCFFVSLKLFGIKMNNINLAVIWRQQRMS